MFAIMQFDKPEKNYMILESIKSAPAKVVHVIFIILHPDFEIELSRYTQCIFSELKIIVGFVLLFIGFSFGNRRTSEALVADITIGNQLEVYQSPSDLENR